MNNTQHQRAFNATAAGQRQLCESAQEIGLCLMMTRKIRAMGGTGWNEDWIQSANQVLLQSIKNDLITEYNGLVTKQAEQQST